MAIHSRIVFFLAFAFSLWYGVHVSPTDHLVETGNEVLNGDQNVSFTHIDYPNEDLIEDFKAAFLQQLNLSEAPTSVIPMKVNREIVNLLMEKNEVEFQPKSIFYPKNGVFSCIQSNLRDCSRFEFYLNLDINSVEKVFLWFHKKGAWKPVSFSVHFVNSTDIHYYNESSSEFDIQMHWIKFHLELSALEEVNGTLQCTVEVTGLYDFKDEDLPILVVAKPKPHENNPKQDNRVKRGHDKKCRAVDRFIDFGKIEWDRWVIEPVILNIRACSGGCPYVQSSVNISYGSLVYRYEKYDNIREDNTCSKFWVPRCYPSTMDKVKILFVKNNSTEIQMTELKEMVVGSCACMSHSCYLRDKEEKR